MPDFYVLGETVTQPWTVLDLADAPLTGMTSPADITFTLQRQSGSLMIAAVETITFVENVGSAGHYSIRFTPANLGVYYLELREINVLTGQRTYSFTYSILSAGAVFLPTYANAYCAESDIERWVQQTIDATSQPSSTATAGFAESRAAVLESLCFRYGLSITPTTIVAGTRIEDLLREANAIGAALDWTIAAQFRVAASKSDRVDLLGARWIEYYGTAENDFKDGILTVEVSNLACRATDHILSGDTLANPDTSTPTALPIGFSMGDLF